MTMGERIGEFEQANGSARMTTEKVGEEEQGCKTPCNIFLSCLFLLSYYATLSLLISSY